MPYRAKKNYKRFEKPKVTNLEVTEPDELINFLMKKFPDRSHNKVKSWLRNKTVELNGAVVTLYNQKLIAGDKISIHWKRIASGRDLKGITIVYEDSDIIVINKPAGMLSVATAKSNETAYSILSQHIKEQNPNNRIFIVHRLDRETSGLMMFAKSEEIQALLQEDWKTNIYDRRYIAVTAGDKPIGDGVYESYLAQNK
ncbi:MAG: RNA pseudouridine synthase, partial [Bacteroidales bacterium]|nr:RNA pseudouridine synthase [Bacteroidales bacterium]